MTDTPELRQELLLMLIVSALTKHPDWFASIVTAMQEGLAQALMDERTKTARLAYGFSFLVTDHPATAKKRAPLISAGLEELVRFFDGAPVADTIRSLLPDHD